MPKIVTTEDGIQHEFPDDASIDEMNNLLSISSPPSHPKSAKEIFQQETGIDQPGLLRNVSGGIVNSLSELLKSLPDLHKMMPNSLQNAFPYQQGQSPIDKFDAYKAMGTKNQPLNTLAGLEQGIGEMLSFGNPISKTIQRGATLGSKAINYLKPLNPLNLTAKAIAKDVLSTAYENKKIYSGLYNNLWKESESKGIDKFTTPIDIDVETLRKYTPNKKIAGVEDFIKNKTLENAHKAKSDLLAIQRDLEEKTTMRTSERKQYKATTNAINDIQSNMFKDKGGIVNNDLLNKYNTIQNGYKNEVVPYKNNAIKRFQRNKISPKELVNALSRGEFMAKRGKFHPAIGIRKNYIPMLTKGAAGLGIADLIYTGNHHHFE